MRIRWIKENDQISDDEKEEVENSEEDNKEDDAPKTKDKDPLNAFRLLFNDGILGQIVKRTNKNLEKSKNWSRDKNILL
jgi:hypothetical protein